MGIGSVFQKAKDKVVGGAKKAVDKTLDFVTDTTKSVFNIALSPFTGGFDIPDINVDSGIAIDNATTVDFTPSNKPIPVCYGEKVERAVKNIFVDTAGDKNQYLYMCGVIGLGMTQDSNNGSRLFDLIVDDSVVDIVDADGSGVISDYLAGEKTVRSGPSLMNLYGGGFPLFGGKGGHQPPRYTVKHGRFKDRIEFQLFDGSDDQPASELLLESDKWTSNHQLRGVQYIALKFTWTNDEILDENNENLTNPFSSLPRVVVVAPGKNVPKLVERDDTYPAGYKHDTDVSNYNNPGYLFVSTPSDWSVAFSSGSYSHTAVRRDGYGVSGNPVEILLDYMLNNRYGAGIALSKIDQASFVNAAVACERYRNETSNSIFSTNYLNQVYVPNAYQDIRPLLRIQRVMGIDDDREQTHLGVPNNPYYRQFVIETGLTHLQNINRILSSIGGIMPYVNGKFKLTLENAGTPDNSFDIPSDADLKSSSTFTFTDDNIIGGIQFQSGALEDSFNQIKLNYTDLDNRSQNNSVVWPPNTDQNYTVFRRQDNEIDLIGNVTNAGIMNAAHAAHFAKVLVLKSRNKQNIVFKTTESATDLVPGDLIRVNSNVIGIDHMFRINTLTMDQYGEIEINAYRHYPNNYDFDAGTLFDNGQSYVEFLNNNLKRPTIINAVPNIIKAPSNLTAIRVVDENPNTGFASSFANFELRWIDESVNAGLNSYEVQYKSNTSDFYYSTSTPKLTSTKLNLTLLVNYGGTIDFRVRTISPNGTVSAFTSISVNSQAPLGNRIVDGVLPINANYWADFAQLSSGAGVGTANTDGTITTGESTEEL